MYITHNNHILFEKYHTAGQSQGTIYTTSSEKQGSAVQCKGSGAGCLREFWHIQAVVADYKVTVEKGQEIRHRHLFQDTRGGIGF